MLNRMMKKDDTSIYYITFLFCLCALQLFSFKYITFGQWQLVYDVIICLLIIQIFVSKILRVVDKGLFHNEILILMLIPFFSAIPAYLFHKQPWEETFLAARPCLLMLFYFYIKRKNPRIERIESICVNLGIIVSAIYLIQAIIYPTVYFQQQKEQDIFQEREGIIRIFIQDPLYIVFALLFLTNRLFLTPNKKDILLFAICLSGIFFTGTRQVIFSTLGIVLLFFLTSLDFRSNKTYSILFILTIFVVILFYSGGVKYIDKLITLTSEQQVINKDYVRMQEINFYFNTYMPSTTSYVVGNGYQYGKSDYGKEINRVETDQGFYRSDVGLFGALNMFGLIYLIPIAIIFFKVFRAKLMGRRFYKYFFIYVLFTSFTGENYFLLPWTFTLIFLLLYNIESIVDEKNYAIESGRFDNNTILTGGQ